jgi:PAS domain S-box-containing protein
MNDFTSIIDQQREILITPDGIVVIGKDMNIVVFNEAASRITGFGEDETIGKQCMFLFKESSNEIALISEAISKNRVYSNLAFKIKDDSGNLIDVLASITPVLKSGNVISIVLVFRNTKEMYLMADELKEKTSELIDQKNKLDAIFNSNIEGTFTIDQDWNVTSFNNSAIKVTGYKRSEAIGKKCWEIFNSSLCRNGCHMEQTMHKGKATMGNELEIINKKGKKIPIRVNSGILMNNKNEKVGAVETFIDISEIKNLSAHLEEKFSFENIIGNNKELRQILFLLESVAQTDSSVLITGESGTGKELAARAIHLHSLKLKMPFIAVNCSAFAESLIESELFGHEKGAFTGAIKDKVGKFELAQGGTLFLDEIGDISIAVQTKLLRVLETHEFERVGGNKIINMNARVIAATNKNISEEISAGRFREDLFYRINVINIHLPPLRERRDDLPLLANHFIAKFNLKFEKNIKQFSSSAYELLEEYSWPGNIRELENVIEHCFVLCRGEVIQVEHLPKNFRAVQLNNESRTSIQNLSNILEVERKLIMDALQRNKWNRTLTAKELNLNPSTLWRKMKKFRIEV